MAASMDKKRLINTKKSTSTNENYLNVKGQEQDTKYKARTRRLQTMGQKKETTKTPLKKSPSLKSKGGLTQLDQDSIASRKF